MDNHTSHYSYQEQIMWLDFYFSTPLIYQKWCVMYDNIALQLEKTVTIIEINLCKTNTTNNFLQYLVMFYMYRQSTRSLDVQQITSCKVPHNTL